MLQHPFLYELDSMMGIWKAFFSQVRGKEELFKQTERFIVAYFDKSEFYDHTYFADVWIAYVSWLKFRLSRLSKSRIQGRYLRSCLREASGRTIGRLTTGLPDTMRVSSKTSEGQRRPTD